MGSLGARSFPLRPAAALTHWGAVSKYLTEVWRPPVVVEKKAGAGGLIGSQRVAKAPPDGHTPVVSGIGAHVIAPEVSNAFDPLQDFTHIAMLGGPPIALAVNGAQPWRNVVDFVAAAKMDAGINSATPGQGRHGHLTAELFRAAHELNLTHVSDKGAGPAVTDLLAKQVSTGFMTQSSCACSERRAAAAGGHGVQASADCTPAEFRHYIVSELERRGAPAPAVLAVR